MYLCLQLCLLVSTCKHVCLCAWYACSFFVLSFTLFLLCVCVYKHETVYMCECVCVCMFVCDCEFMHVCVCAYMYLCNFYHISSNRHLPQTNAGSWINAKYQWRVWYLSMHMWIGMLPMTPRHACSTEDGTEKCPIMILLVSLHQHGCHACSCLLCQVFFVAWWSVSR